VALRASFRGWAVVPVLCAAIAIAGAGDAFAAGTGYGGSGGVGSGIAVGFSSVIVVKTLGPNGGTVVGPHVTVFVPKKVGHRHLQIVITKGNRHTVRHHLVRTLRHRKVVASFGLLLWARFTPVRTRKRVKVTFTDSRLHPHDVVAIYSGTTGKFTRRRVYVHGHKIVVFLKASESIAILR